MTLAGLKSTACVGWYLLAQPELTLACDMLRAVCVAMSTPENNKADTFASALLSNDGAQEKTLKAAH